MTGLTPRALAYLAATGSLVLLAAAYAFQAAGYAPCAICLWQRWPHLVAIAAGVLVAAVPPRLLWMGTGALAALTTAGLGLYHTGVERGLLPGPGTCSGAGGDVAAGTDFLSTTGAPNVVRCDEVAWAFAGLSMASWNALASLALAALWIYAALRAAGVSAR